LQVIIIDNFDSFTHNIKQVLIYAGCPSVKVISYAEFEQIENSNVIVSPGPGLPSDYPKLKRIFGRNNRILGICLGHQLIGEHFGGKLKQLQYPIHGESIEVQVLDQKCCLFKGMKSFRAGRYHSWYVSESCLTVTAKSSDGLIMGLRNEDQSVLGIQFHPESVLTPDGELMFRNWIHFTQFCA
jgi:anthranilate synthase component 2